MEKIRSFLKRKNIVLSAKRYGIDALGAMAQGLFCSLLIGTIVKTLGERLGVPFLVDVGNYASAMSGAAMAIAIGAALQAPPLVLFSLATVGYAANALGSTSLIPGQSGAGGPLAVLFIAVIAAECGKAVSKETRIDILVTPLATILVGVGLSAWWAPAIGTAATALGNLIMWATDLQPFLMGIIVSVLMGMALTLPISSAAICAAFGLTGLAGGAAVAGCCANMVGFAVLSFRENHWGGLVSQGLGTSMLQMGNIVKNPRIWLPAILTSAITGPISTCLFRLEMNGPPVSSGMGTCGLVGQIGVWTGWISPSEQAIANGAAAIAPGVMDWAGLLLVSFVLPAVLCWTFGLLFRRIGWIREGDLTLQ
ncbi:MAG: PTS sugar transporter subunit IIC [Oscillospiraceae bacterium]|nr:PTS sugar transporter subunit IIC [Oscillospiraceae bacterium]